MPNRVIKESINDSLGLSEGSLFAQDLYKRLITYADDYGRFNSDTMIMRARLYAREYGTIHEDDIINGLIELVGVGKIQFYTARHFNQGRNRVGVYGVFPNWAEHQRVRETKAKCPDPDDTDINDWYLRRFVPVDMKAHIVERDGFKCRICGKYVTTCRDAKRFVKLGTGLFHIDHIVPVLQGGRATLENLQLTCPECNLKRKKRFTFKELLEFASNGDSCNDSPQLAATRRNLPPESNPNPNQNPNQNPSTNARARGGGAFDRFWAEYPKKVGKGQAQKAFSKVSVPVETLIEAVQRQKNSVQWQKDGGQYIPNPATWLNQKRWEDDLDSLNMGGGVTHGGTFPNTGPIIEKLPAASDGWWVD